MAATTTTAGAALYVARDNLLEVNLCDGLPYAEAGSIATAATLAASSRGERVAMADGVDRFTVRRAPFKPAPPVTFSELEAEAMLCVWEEFLERRSESGNIASLQARAGREESPGVIPITVEAAAASAARVERWAPFIAYWEGVGAGAMRHVAKDLAPFALAVYDAIPRDLLDGYAYDWEIIPATLDQIDWTSTGYTLPDPKTAARAVVALLGEEWPEEEA